MRDSEGLSPWYRRSRGEAMLKSDEVEAMLHLHTTAFRPSALPPRGPAARRAPGRFAQPVTPPVSAGLSRSRPAPGQHHVNPARCIPLVVQGHTHSGILLGTKNQNAKTITRRHRSRSPAL